MQKVTVTKEMIQNYFSRMKGRNFDPNHPFCRICSTISFSGKKPLEINYFCVGETVYRVTYPNGQKGFYHVSCIDAPEGMHQKIMVEEILRLDVDKWNGLEDFITELVEKNFTDKKVISRIQERFNCSHSTAWRRLGQFKAHSKNSSSMSV